MRDCVSLALEAGDFDYVLERTAEIPPAGLEGAEALFDRASALMGKRQYAAAVEHLRALLDRAPDLAAAQINLGLCYYALGRFAEARAPLDVAYAAGVRSTELLRLLVSTYHHLGLIDEAVTLADAHPPSPDSGAALPGVYALLYIDADQPRAAGRWAAQALDANPDSVDGLVAQATLDAARMQVNRARNLYSRALELAPQTGRAWIGLGTLFLLDQDFSRAREHIEQGLQFMPGHTGSWLLLAWTHILAGDLEAAERALLRAMELDRSFAETHGALASVYALRGDRESTEREIEIAQRLDPEGLSSEFARSVLIAHSGDPAAARQIILGAARSLSAGSSGALSRILEHASRH